MASAGVISCLNTGQTADIASFQVDAAASRANVVVDCCSASSVGAALWVLPSNAYTALFINCNVVSVWTYSQLPQTTNVIEGDEFSVSDANTSTWGATVSSGGGSTHVLVRYDGTNYTVVAKMTNPFTAFAFDSTGSTTARTLPDRLANVNNVLDYGADPTGATFSDTAIMAAFNAGRITLTVTGSNQTASFTGSVSGANLTASSVTGTINVGDTITDNNVNLPRFVTILSGPGGGAGVYVLSSSIGPISSQAMFTVNNTLTFASVPTAISTQYIAQDLNNLLALGLPIGQNPGFPNANVDCPTPASTTSTTVTMRFVTGVVQVGDVIQFDLANRATVYFPPGTYTVSAPINFFVFTNSNCNCHFAGEMGLSTITGNFADYVFEP